MSKNTHTFMKKFSIISVFLAVEALICFVPYLGSIQIGPVVATLAMVPVIIIGIVLGPLEGSILGFFAGLFSFIYWTFIDPANPSAILFTPWNSLMEKPQFLTLIICFVPRILTGTVSGFLNLALKKLKKFRFVIVGIVGSLTNTFLVLFGTYLLWGKGYASAIGLEYSALLGVVFSVVTTNGIFEAAVCGILAPAISIPLDIIKKRI